MIAGPFFGEFGWELMKWQGYLRYLSCNVGEVEVLCQNGHKYLYKDFASKVTEVGAGFNQPNMWQPAVESNNMTPCKKICENYRLPQKFIQYGKKKRGKGYDILIHARQCRRDGDKITGNRYWGDLKFVMLLDMFIEDCSVAFIGTEQDMAFEGANDLRGIPLEQLADVMCSSKVVVGASSGVLHYASLCGTPHVVWTDKRKWNVGGIKTTNYNRYKKWWNPLKTPCSICDECNWHPPVDNIAKRINRFLKGDY